MNTKLGFFKNLGWIIGIGVCLIALLVGLITAGVNKYSGDGSVSFELAGSSGQEQQEQPQQQSTPGQAGQLMEVGESVDGGQAYIDSLHFLCDSALIGLRDYGVLNGGTATAQVWGSSEGNIPADKYTDFTIRNPADGSETTPALAAMTAKPSHLIISLGMDSLNDVTQESFIQGYTSLVQSIQAQSPDTKIALCSLSSVSVAYAGTDNLTKEAVKQAEEWIQQVCRQVGVFYLDVGSSVTDSSGSLYSEFASANGKALNSAGINKVLEYIRSHTF